jgi:hypothetical protein
VDGLIVREVVRVVQMNASLLHIFVSVNDYSELAQDLFPDRLRLKTTEFVGAILSLSSELHYVPIVEC